MSDESKDDIRNEARNELADEFGEADYPVSSQMEFLPALSAGPTTEFEFGDKKVTAMELASIGGSDMNFPYEDLNDFLDDALDVLEDKGYFDSDE